jgi:hypothetical protein
MASGGFGQLGIVPDYRGRMATKPPATESGSALQIEAPALIVLFVGLLLVALVVAASLYAPGCPPVDLTRDALLIDSRFYGMTVPRSSVDVKRIRVLDLDAEPAWKPVSRTGGFGNRYYRAGTFRTANGRTVKLFTTGGRRLVLLPSSRQDGTPVLLEVAEPDAFVAQVRETWAVR